MKISLFFIVILLYYRHRCVMWMLLLLKFFVVVVAAAPYNTWLSLYASVELVLEALFFLFVHRLRQLHTLFHHSFLLAAE